MHPEGCGYSGTALGKRGYRRKNNLTFGWKRGKFWQERC